jgi:hypothetical protein
VNNDDSGFLLATWVVKLALTLSVLGFVGYDGFSLVATSFSLSDRAGQYASTAADSYAAQAKDPQAVQKAYEVAFAAAKTHGDVIPASSFHIQPDGSVTLKVDHTAKTLWMQSVGPLKKYTHLSAEGSGAGPS